MQNAIIEDDAALDAVVSQYNASQEEIELVTHYHPMEADVTPYLSGENAVDIYGPMGIRERDEYQGKWMDLQPLIDASGTDLGDYNPVMIEFFQDINEGQTGLPYALFPSFIFVNKDLFDKAGLPYPPQEYDAPYVDENGKEHPWNLDTLRTLAMKLTIDANGNNATGPDFDADNIVQFGYLEYLTDMRGALTLFGPGSLIAEDGKTAQVPEHWREGARWIYDAMWKDHFWPTDAYLNSEILANGNAFQSGNLAMAHVHTWFAAEWAIGPDIIDFTWDTAVVPANGDRVTARMHADTFGIPKASRQPEAAFDVLAYLLSPDSASRLLELTGGIPARESLQKAHVRSTSEKVFPGQNINWQVVLDSIAYADIPSHESWSPGLHKGWEAYNKTWTRLATQPDLDVDAELDRLIEELQAILDDPSR